MTTANQLLNNNSKCLASLTLQGWVQDIGSQIDLSIAYCFVSDDKQSSVYNGAVVSIQALLARYTQRTDALCEAMENVLRDYLSGLYDAAEITITHNEANLQAKEVELEVRAKIKVGNLWYDTAAAIMIKNGYITRFTKINEGKS